MTGSFAHEIVTYHDRTILYWQEYDGYRYYSLASQSDGDGWSSASGVGLRFTPRNWFM